MRRRIVSLFGILALTAGSAALADAKFEHLAARETDVTVVQAVLAGSATMFAVPGRVLAPGTKYKIAIGTVAQDGNTSFVETSFTTAKK